MITGHLNNNKTYDFLLQQSLVWKLVFDWLKSKQGEELPAKADYELHGSDIRAIVRMEHTEPREERYPEAHDKEYDVHVCLRSGEIIEWAPRDSLKVREPYNAQADVTLFERPDSAQQISMIPYQFVIFGPQDAHMPKVRLFNRPMVHKLVIKIRKELVEPLPNP
jgi:YhcH/YjgK/YiaL family protein